MKEELAHLKVLRFALRSSYCVMEFSTVKGERTRVGAMVLKKRAPRLLDLI